MTSKGASERRIDNQSGPQSVQADPLDKYFSHAEFRTAFTTLSNSVTAQNDQPAAVSANPMANSAAAKIRDFT